MRTKTLFVEVVFFDRETIVIVGRYHEVKRSQLLAPYPLRLEQDLFICMHFRYN